MVAEAQPRVAEQLREPVRAVVQLAVRDRLAGRGHDVRDLVGPFSRVFTWPHTRPRLYDVANAQNDVMTLRMTSPALHRAERLVDLVELDRARHHRGGVEAAGLDEVGEALEVAAHLTRAVLAALQRLLVEEQVERRDRDLRPRRGSCRP